MNYAKIYEQIIQRAQNRDISGYYEKHHIIPKCVGGSDHIDNIVKLSAREHFICHWLLHVMHPDNDSLFYAFDLMCRYSNCGKQKRYVPSSRVIEACKIERSKRMSKQFKNRVITEEHKKKLSDSAKNRVGANKGRQFSEEHKKRLSDSKKGKMAYNVIGENNPMKNPEIAKKVSNAKKGKPSNRKGCILTDEHKQKLRLARQLYLNKKKGYDKTTDFSI